MPKLTVSSLVVDGDGGELNSLIYALIGPLRDSVYAFVG